MKKIFEWLSRAWSNTIKWIKPKASTAITIVNAVKYAVESGVVSNFVKSTKTKVDDVAYAAILQWLPKISEQMLIAEKILEAGKTDEEIYQALISYLQDKNPEARIKFYAELAARITQALSDDKITFGEALAISQFVYAEFKK